MATDGESSDAPNGRFAERGAALGQIPRRDGESFDFEPILTRLVPGEETGTRDRRWPHVPITPA